ncbi:hypothetical protein YC2023_041299 [Brassica napus]
MSGMIGKSGRGASGGPYVALARRTPGGLRGIAERSRRSWESGMNRSLSILSLKSVIILFGIGSRRCWFPILKLQRSSSLSQPEFIRCCSSKKRWERSAVRGSRQMPRYSKIGVSKLPTVSFFLPLPVKGFFFRSTKCAAKMALRFGVTTSSFSSR